MINLMGSSAHITSLLLASSLRGGSDDTATPLMSAAKALDGQSYRRGRVEDLRRLFASGEYAVAPHDVANKMLGRAFCDQLVRLYDS